MRKDKRMSKSGDKPYKCADCGTHFITWTNHHGTTWNNCKKCSNQNSLSLCMTDEGIALRQVDRDNTIEADIITYRLNMDLEEDRTIYSDIKQTLKEMGTKLWQVHHFQGGSTIYLVKRFKDPEQETQYKGYMKEDKIKLSTNHMFDNQWTEPDGPRICDSHEVEYPNSSIKEGYFIKITDEIRDLRHNRLKCGYCGFQTLEGQVGDQHCDDEKLASYNSVTPTEVGQLRRVRIKEQDYTVVISRVVSYDRLNYNDQEEWGEEDSHEKTITAYSEDNALDKFHRTYPIKVLEDFEVYVKGK